jgi:hypothetical protein
MTTTADPVKEPENQPEPAPAADTSTWRRSMAIVLVVLTSLSVVVAAVTVWAHNAVLDTDKFMETVGPALDDPALYTAVGEKVSEQTLAALDLETRISAALTDLDDFLFGSLLDALDIGDRGRQILESVDRPSLEDLAPALSTGLEERITARIEGFVSSEEFRAAVPALIERAHRGVIALARGDLEQIPNVTVADGEVTLNLIPIIVEAIRRVLPDLSGLGPDITLPDQVSERAVEAREQLRDALGATIPENFGQLTLMSEDQLNALQDGVVRLDRLMWGLIALSVILAIVTLLVSQTRLRTAMHLAIGLGIGFIITVLLVDWLEGQVVQAIVDPTDAAAAREIVAQVLSGLRQGALLIALIAIVAGVVLWLVNRPEKPADDEVEPVSA